MVHEKILGKRLSHSVEHLSKKRLLVLLAFILSLLSERKHLTKEQRRSLAITENQLGIRKAVMREEEEISPRRRGSHRRKHVSRKRGHRRNIQAAQAMRYARSHGVSLKEAWNHVKRRR